MLVRLANRNATRDAPAGARVLVHHRACCDLGHQRRALDASRRAGTLGKCLNGGSAVGAGRRSLRPRRSGPRRHCKRPGSKRPDLHGINEPCSSGCLPTLIFSAKRYSTAGIDALTWTRWRHSMSTEPRWLIQGNV